VDAALPALQRALTIAADSDNPLARGQALAALLLAEWKGGDLEAALRSGEDALQLFRELGHSTMEGTVAYRLAAVTRGLGRSQIARTHARLAIDAGETAGTRTTVALGHLNLARLDLNDDAPNDAMAHLGAALAIIDPSADRWVLVEALEVVARLLSVVDPTEAAELLHAATVIRTDIRQPVPPTDAAELAATRARIDALGLIPRTSSPTAGDVHARASAALNEVAQTNRR
jgi:tetratricopeptide (TPR) repeat protein